MITNTKQNNDDWIKCSDRLPEKYHPILFCAEGEVYAGEMWESYFVSPTTNTGQIWDFPHKYVKCWREYPEHPSTNKIK